MTSLAAVLGAVLGQLLGVLIGLPIAFWISDKLGLLGPKEKP